MPDHKYTESHLEDAALEWLEELGYSIGFGPDIASDGENPERKSYSDVVLETRLASAIERINTDVPIQARDEALKKVLQVPLSSPSLIERNRAFHAMLAWGIDVEFKNDEGELTNRKVYLVDRKHPENNDWYAVNQFTIIEGGANRRPDILVFVNGLPVAAFELKNPADEKATVEHAFRQIQTYKKDIPSLFAYNEVCVLSDGLDARAGSLTADFDRFMRWRTMDGDEIAPKSIPQLEVMVRGMFAKGRLIDIITNFVTYEDDGEKVFKILAAYHQYHATNKAVASTLTAVSADGDKQCGVVWHTQGSGKSLTMVFYAGKIIQKMNNPTLVVLTDRNDLDEQLFGTFSRSAALLRQKPVKADSRDHLRELLKVASGGVVFTTIQKFMPDEKGGQHELLSDRGNIVVIADEAHRSQYGFIEGFARHMRDALPNASYIGFTGTPVELEGANTRAVFGDYVDIYDIAQAVEDKATVPIYYEARLAKLELSEEEKPHIDPNFEEVMEGEEESTKEEAKSQWARLEALVGSKKRIELLAKDIVDHFERRRGAMDGKGMIVTMSRRIAVDLYDAIVALRPDWHNDDDRNGFLKVVITGSASDPENFQRHIRNKKAREAMAKRMKDSKDELKLVIVRDMWLTGFDAPSMHTMYVDKPMRGHGLMQAIARVNRVFKDKEGGLVVDYLGIASELKKALAHYSSGDHGRPTVPIEEAVSLMLEKYEIVQGMYHGFGYTKYFELGKSEKLRFMAESTEFILGLEDGQKRYIEAVTALGKAFSIAVPHEEALRIRDDVAFFQAIKAAIVKMSIVEGPGGTGVTDRDLAVRQIVESAVVSNEVVNILEAAGLKTPDISVLSDEFLEEVRGMKHKNLALEALKRLLQGEINRMSRNHLVKSRSFATMLEETIRKYQNKTIEAAAVMAELVRLAKDIKAERERGAELGLSDEELAFYEALADNESAQELMGDETLKQIAQELVKKLRNTLTVDWTMKESVRAKMRVEIKRLLKKYKYPPDQQDHATQIVVEQAELCCSGWGNV